jgi:hypothetical protein
MRLFMVLSMEDSLDGAEREFMAIFVSLPVYTTTPTAQLVFLRVDPRNKKFHESTAISLPLQNIVPLKWCIAELGCSH